MKNMKKTIIGVAIIAMFLITMMGSVNAASMTASASQVEVDKGVSVTVSTKVTMQAAQFKLTYDTSKFTYTGASYDGETQPASVKTGKVGTITTTGDGIQVAIANAGAAETTKSVTLNFTAKATTANVAEETFTISGFKAGTSAEKDNNINATATVKVVAATPVEPEKPGDVTDENNKPAGEENKDNGTKTPATSTANNDKKVGTNGKVITKLNQTGAPLFIGAAVVVALAGATLVIRKRK